ncbi:MAG: hypothetical protein LBT36_04035 [Oscillospiraceae bacterium]|jgi:hypothetical protein|nr:hypothetical protein [Oscillospiraceae bacterium]
MRLLEYFLSILRKLPEMYRISFELETVPDLSKRLAGGIVCRKDPRSIVHIPVSRQQPRSAGEIGKVRIANSPLARHLSIGVQSPCLAMDFIADIRLAAPCGRDEEVERLPARVAGVLPHRANQTAAPSGMHCILPEGK